MLDASWHWRNKEQTNLLVTGSVGSVVTLVVAGSVGSVTVVLVLAHCHHQVLTWDVISNPLAAQGWIATSPYKSDGPNLSLTSSTTLGQSPLGHSHSYWSTPGFNFLFSLNGGKLRLPQGKSVNGGTNEAVTPLTVFSMRVGVPNPKFWIPVVLYQWYRGVVGSLHLFPYLHLLALNKEVQ